MKRQGELEQGLVSWVGKVESQHLKIVFLVYILFGHSAFGSRPSSSDSSFYKDCVNEDRSSWQGLIQSPTYPLLYDPNTCHDWFIQGSQNETITISFEDLEIPIGSAGSCNDSLSFLHIGPIPEKRLCGSITRGLPIVYISKRSHVWIKFRTHGYNTGRGFSLRYVIGEVPSPENCLNDQFRCKSGKCIRGEWHCNGGNECGDGSDEERCQDLHFLTTPQPGVCGPQMFGCDDAITTKFICHRNMLLCDGVQNCMYGEDEEHCEHIGFKCGGSLTEANGYLQSPSFPAAYPNKADCEWIISVKYGGKVQLRFLAFQLEAKYNTDYVAIYDGKSENANLIGMYYGGEEPPKVVESTGNTMYIRFHSDDKVTDNGFNASYQIKGACFGGQIACGFEENDCYTSKERCDRKWDCPRRGGDERGCGTCAPPLFQCDPDSPQCFSEQQHCDGLGHCSNKQDEDHCDSTRCGPHNGTFLCNNQRCIYESWKCDGTDDCDDYSDEMHCSVPSVKVITAAVIGSLICGLLLVIALGCTCKLYALRLQEQHSVVHRGSTPVTRIQDQIFARHLAPPPYAEAMVTSRPFEEVQREYMEHVRVHGSRTGGRRNRHRNRPSRSQGGRAERERGTSSHSDRRGSRSASATTQTGETTTDDDDVPLLDISNNPPGEGDADLIVPLDEDSSDTEDEDSEGYCDPADNSNVNISIASGVTAQWRRTRRKPPASGSNTDYSPVVGSSNQTANDQTNRDAASIDTASASDSVILSIDGDDFKEESTSTSTSTQTQIQPTSTANQTHRRRSCDDDITSDGASVDSENLECPTLPHSQSTESVGSGEAGDSRPLLS